MTLSAGSIAFTGFNADGNDSIALVTLETISTGTVIHFSDRTWDGTSFTSAETAWTWTATTDVAPGTIISISNIFSGTLTADVGDAAFVITTNRGLSASADTIYAYLGTDENTPTTFLAAIANKNFADAGVLTNTGLTVGSTALNLNLNGGVDIGAYTGSRTSETGYANYLALINDPANWTTQDATGDQSGDGTSPDTPFAVTPFTVCFATGTRIATPSGDVPVQDLRTGDQVLTVSLTNTSVEVVRWVGHRSLDLRSHPSPDLLAPVIIRRHALAPDVPLRDLTVSPDHAMEINGMLIPARRLVNGMTIVQDLTKTQVTYHHVELDRHAILLANGARSESYLDTGNRGFFSDANVPVVLHPVLMPTRSSLSCLPLAEDDAAVEPNWRRIHDRALALGHMPGGNITTLDPNLSIMLNSQTHQPTEIAHARYSFVLPRGTTEVRLKSRSSRMTDIAPWQEDRRRLGIRLARITVVDAVGTMDLPLDHPILREGWWAPEWDGAALRRWTDGDAVIKLPVLTGPAMLQITVSDTITYPVQRAHAA